MFKKKYHFLTINDDKELKAISKGLIEADDSLTLKAINELTPIIHGHYQWESLGQDPWFNCNQEDISIGKGWYMIELEISANANFADAKFYFDYGNGYSENNSILLNYKSGKLFKRLVWLKQTPHNIRFDPAEDFLHFTIDHLAFSKVYLPFAVSRMLRRLTSKSSDFTDIKESQKIEKVREYAKSEKIDFVSGLYQLYNQTFQKKVFRYELKYSDWIKVIEPTKFTDYFANKVNKNFINKPEDVLSLILLARDGDALGLQKTIESFKYQSSNAWEVVIIVNQMDLSSQNVISKFKNKYPEQVNLLLIDSKNLSQLKNEAAELIHGNYLGVIRSADELSQYFVEIILDAVFEESYPEVIYTDSDLINAEGVRSSPNFKPAYSPDLLMNRNYIDGPVVFDTCMIKNCGGWDTHFDDELDDYDLLLKITEQTKNIIRLPYILYHRSIYRPDVRSIAINNPVIENQLMTLLINAGLRQNKECEVVKDDRYGKYRTRYKLTGEPLVSIVIPFKDKPELLVMCVEAILKRSTYKNFEIIGVSNNSQEQETFEVMSSLIARDPRIKFVEYNVPFNYSKINNFAVREHVNGEQIILLNNDIEVLSADWIESMLEYSQRDDVGCVGAKLYYPTDTIQHAGVIVGIGRTAGHSHRHLPINNPGYQDRLNLAQNFSAVTAACLMVKKSIFDEVNGLNENELKVAFNDVDFCLRIREKGYWNVYTPYCEAYHYESISRGHEDTPEKIKRFIEESGYLRDRHKKYYRSGDPFYNINLTLESEDFKLAATSKLANQKFSPQPFVEEIKVEILNVDNAKHSRLCIFSHYDKDGIIDPYVVYYLQCLYKYFDIIFVSTANGINHEECLKALPYCIRVIAKKNYGYDFGAYKSGLNRIQDVIKYQASYEWLLLCNDSIYAPFDGFSSLITAMNSGNFDVIAMSDNHEIAHHLQSYFIVYNRYAYQSELFQSFWDEFVVYEDKTMLIEQCEVGFSNKLIEQSDLRIHSLAKRHDGTYANQLHFYWRELIDDGFPAIKIQLLRDNPMSVDIDGWEDVIIEVSDYPVELIKNHLKRFK